MIAQLQEQASGYNLAMGAFVIAGVAMLVSFIALALRDDLKQEVKRLRQEVDQLQWLLRTLDERWSRDR